MWSCSASLLPNPLQPSTPILQKGGLTPKPSQLTLTHLHSQFQLNQESPWTNMLEKKIKPRKAQLRGTLRAHAKKLETSRYCRGPARSLDGVTRRPCLSLAQPLGAAEAPSWDVGARTEVTVSRPHGQAGPPTEPHSSDFNSWPVGHVGTRPQNLQLRQGQPRTSSVPSSLKRASHTGRCTRWGEGGHHKTEGPQADHELQAGPGRGGALPRDPIHPQSGVSAASRRVQVGDSTRPTRQLSSTTFYTRFCSTPATPLQESETSLAHGQRPCPKTQSGVNR